jgi:hypothetical protein
MHWGRGVAWAILEQKPDTIFVLTTNYIDGWEKGSREKGDKTPPQPTKMAASLKKMCLDVYGPDKKKWPTINVVVLAKAGKDSTGANRVLGEEFGPIIKSFRADGSVIDDIKKYMNDKERELYRQQLARSIPVFPRRHLSAWRLFLCIHPNRLQPLEILCRNRFPAFGKTAMFQR